MNFGKPENFCDRHPYFFQNFHFKFEGLPDDLRRKFEDVVKRLGATVDNSDPDYTLVEHSYFTIEENKRREDLFSIDYIADSLMSKEPLDMNEYRFSTNKKNSEEPCCLFAKHVLRTNSCESYSCNSTPIVPENTSNSKSSGVDKWKKNRTLGSQNIQKENVVPNELIADETNNSNYMDNGETFDNGPLGESAAASSSDKRRNTNPKKSKKSEKHDRVKISRSATKNSLDEHGLTVAKRGKKSESSRRKRPLDPSSERESDKSSDDSKRNSKIRKMEKTIVLSDSDLSSDEKTTRTKRKHGKIRKRAASPVSDRQRNSKLERGTSVDSREARKLKKSVYVSDGPSTSTVKNPLYKYGSKIKAKEKEKSKSKRPLTPVPESESDDEKTTRTNRNTKKTKSKKAEKRQRVSSDEDIDDDTNYRKNAKDFADSSEEFPTLSDDNNAQKDLKHGKIRKRAASPISDRQRNSKLEQDTSVDSREARKLKKSVYDSDGPSTRTVKNPLYKYGSKIEAKENKKSKSKRPLTPVSQSESDDRSVDDNRNGKAKKKAKNIEVVSSDAATSSDEKTTRTNRDHQNHRKTKSKKAQKRRSTSSDADLDNGDTNYRENAGQSESSWGQLNMSSDDDDSEEDSSNGAEWWRYLPKLNNVSKNFVQPKREPGDKRRGSTMKLQEQKLMIAYLVVKNLIKDGKSRMPWKRMHDDGYLRKRSVETLNNHYRKTLLPSIKSFGLPKKILQQFLETRDD